MKVLASGGMGRSEIGGVRDVDGDVEQGGVRGSGEDARERGGCPGSAVLPDGGGGDGEGGETATEGENGRHG